MLKFNTLTTVQYGLIFCSFSCPYMVKWRNSGIIIIYLIPHKSFVWFCMFGSNRYALWFSRLNKFTLADVQKACVSSGCEVCLRQLLNMSVKALKTWIISIRWNICTEGLTPQYYIRSFKTASLDGLRWMKIQTILEKSFPAFCRFPARLFWDENYFGKNGTKL